MMKQSQVTEYLEALKDSGQKFSTSSIARDQEDGDVLLVSMMVTFRVSEEALRCTCEKGLYCPYVIQEGWS